MILEYGSNEMDQVSYVFETINGDRRSIGITYDEDSRVTSYRKGSVTEAYTYDAYSRVTNKVTTVAIDEETQTRLTEALTYRTNSAGNATDQVNTLAITLRSGATVGMIMVGMSAVSMAGISPWRHGNGLACCTR